MVSQSSQRTLAQPTRTADPGRSFNERSHGLMRKIHALTTSLSDFGVEIALLIRTPYVEFTYESEDDMLRSFNTNLPEQNRFRPQDVENLFRGRALTCPSINTMSPRRGRSGHSSPTPSTSSASSVSSAPLLAEMGLSLPTSPPTYPAGVGITLPNISPISASPPLAADTEVTVSPSPPQGEGLSSPNTGLGPALMSDSPPPASPVMDISSILNFDCWPAATDAPFPDTTGHRPLPSSRPTLMSDVPLPTSPDMDISNILNLNCWPAATDAPFPDTTGHRPLPSSRPVRSATPTPSVNRQPRLQSPHRVLKIRTPPKSGRKWFN